MMNMLRCLLHAQYSVICDGVYASHGLSELPYGYVVAQGVVISMSQCLPRHQPALHVHSASLDNASALL